jgi:hypothetical protein
VLKKEYKFEPSNAAADEQPDADGITPSMLDFSWERDVTAQVCPSLHSIRRVLMGDTGHKNSVEGRLEELNKALSSPG